MRKARVLWILIVMILIGGLAVMGLFGIDSFSAFRKIDQEMSFITSQTAVIHVDTSNIPVHIIKSEAGRDIRIHLSGRSRRGLELLSETISQTVSIRIDHKLDGLPVEEVILVVYIPEDYGKDLLIRTSSGLVSVDPIDLTSFTLETTSGGMVAEMISADKITLNTTSGSISLKDYDSRELEIKGTSSAVTVTCSEYDNKIVRIETTSGSIDLTLPSSAEFTYQIATNGKFQTAFPISTSGSNGNTRLEGQLGSGMNSVSLQATSGSVTISAS